MPDLRDDTTDDGFHEIQFSSKQLVFLFMAASVVLIFVFLAGVLVGRDTTARVAEPVGIAENDPENVTEPAAPAAGEPGATTVEDPDAKLPEQPLGYPTELKGAEGRPAPAVTVQQPDTSTAGVNKPDPPVTKPEPPEEPKPKPSPPKPAAAELKVPTTGQPGQWVIQVAALATRQTAAEQVQSLRSKGYSAFLETTAKGLYRVRIGRFRDRAEAERIARRLLKEEGTTSVVQR